MKRFLIKLLSAALVLILLFLTAVGCSSNGKALMELDGEELSINIFQLYLSRMKGTVSSSYGSDSIKASFWDTIMDTSGTTYNDYFKAQILEEAKLYLAAVYAFEEEGLELPDSTIDAIDKEIDELIENDANGSKDEFNAMLSKYGVNYKMLREAKIIEAKIAYLNDYLLGTDGSKISPTLVEEYYQDNYARFKQVFIYTYALVYETDENGDEVWYDSADNKKISYDKTAERKKDENGVEVKDKNGDFIYVTEDGKIAYDKKNAKRNPLFDENGNQRTRDYTEAELIQASDYAQLILEKCEENNFTLFDAMVENYSEDSGMTEYPDGYYITVDSDYNSKEVVEAVFDMDAGEIRRVNSKYGIHIVMRYETDEGAYDNESNKDFFVDSQTGNYVFMSKLKNYVLAEYIKSKGYMDRIEIDEELLSTVDMKSVEPNFYY